MKKDVTLYNALFPFWMILLLHPVAWLFVLPGNFIIDSVVLLVATAILKIDGRKKFFWKNVWKVFLFGLLSDCIGAGSILLLSGIFKSYGTLDDLYLTVPAVIIAAACIFVFNYFITFKSCDKSKKFKLALTFATVTAPYTFLVQLYH